jgi:hypothetical protein
MTWLQYCDDGFTGLIAKGFGVHEIPHTFTIDADGVLQDEHIGEASIEGKLKKLVNRAPELQTTAKQTQLRRVSVSFEAFVDRQRGLRLPSFWTRPSRVENGDRGKTTSAPFHTTLLEFLPASAGAGRVSSKCIAEKMHTVAPQFIPYLLFHT